MASSRTARRPILPASRIPNAWRFTTKAAGPANPTNLVVAADGSGDFVTVQGAVDSVPPGNTNYTVINIQEWHVY